MLFHSKYKIGFLHNPKTAGIALTEYLENLGFEWDAHPDLPWAYAPSFVNRHAYHPPDHVYGDNAEILPNWKIFTVVRHPYSRCLSNWRYQVEKNLIPVPASNPPSFTEYLDVYDKHLPIQTLYASKGVTPLRHETLVTDLMAFDPLFMDAARLLRQQNVTNSCLFAADLTLFARCTIFNTRRSEFEAFGYKP